MTDFDVFKKAAVRMLNHIDEELSKLHDLLEEELNGDSGHVDDALASVVKLKLAYCDAKRAINAIKEEDLADEEEEEEDEEEDEEEAE